MAEAADVTLQVIFLWYYLVIIHTFSRIFHAGVGGEVGQNQETSLIKRIILVNDVRVK